VAVSGATGAVHPLEKYRSITKERFQTATLAVSNIDAPLRTSVTPSFSAYPLPLAKRPRFWLPATLSHPGTVVPQAVPN
jgi:hypothetical protein